MNVLAAGGYEDDILGNSTWATGDWNADADFTSTDFAVAMVDGGSATYRACGTRADVGRVAIIGAAWRGDAMALIVREP